MSEAKRLHPIASVIHAGKRMKNLILPGIAILFSGGRKDLLIVLGISAAAVLITLISGIWSWLRYTYRFEQDELRIEYGIFIRKKRYIPFERIQSIDFTEGILQQIFGLVKVKIETAGGGGDEEAEAVLTAISKEEAQSIQNYVTAVKNGGIHTANTSKVHQPIYKISMQQLFILSLTSGGVGVVISAVFALFSQLDDFIPYKRIFGNLERWAVHNIISIAILVFIGFFIAWIISLIMTMLKYANFTVIKSGKELIISQGLLEKRRITIPINRIQAIRIIENSVSRVLGYGTIFIESAGGSVTNKEGANVTLLPMVRVKEVRSILGVYLPEFHFTNSFNPVPKRAMLRYIIRSWYIGVPVVILAIIFLKKWGLLFLLLLALLSYWAFLKYKASGWQMEERQLSFRYGAGIRKTIFMKKDKIQSMKIKESYFQRKKDLGTIETFVKSGMGLSMGTVVDMDRDDLEAIWKWYSRNKKNRDGSTG
ncbi:PH domain-containing protein [Bacillus sp. JJ1764]|uniref:PH domain-containing protein n=1 Tax=Bacillus sp. JJ1764 TaxID=3122964 RepID=UPI002FFDBAFA